MTSIPAFLLSSKPDLRRARIAGGDEKPGQQRAFGERDGKGMFATAGADKKNIHEGPRSAARLGERGRGFNFSGDLMLMMVFGSKATFPASPAGASCRADAVGV